MEAKSSFIPLSGAARTLEAAVAIAALLALWLFVRAGRHLKRRHFGHATRNGIGGLLLGAITAVVLLLGLNLLTYERLTAETPVARIRFHQLAPQRFAVTLTTARHRILRTQLDGDDWQIDARVIKWKGIATILGFDPLYRLERLSGRYEHLRQAQAMTPSVVGLAKNHGIAVDQLDHYAAWLPLVDARYGSATYLPMADGAAYEVSLSRSGLLARPANAAAQRAVADWR